FRVSEWAGGGVMRGRGRVVAFGANVGRTGVAGR
ncbi:hypothetical protein STRIP9103_06100, partial [Streptomyces ipomoeae 91-03]